MDMNKNTKIKNKNFNIKDSQNFLHNTKLVEDLLFKSNITKEDFVVEIGKRHNNQGIKQNLQSR